MGDVRLVLTDEAWADLAEVLAQVQRTDGRPAEQRDRLVLEALLSLARRVCALGGGVESVPALGEERGLAAVGGRHPAGPLQDGAAAVH